MGKGTEKRGKWVKMLQQGYVLENESGCGTFQVGVQEGICEEVAFGQRLEDERELARGGLGEECSAEGTDPFCPHMWPSEERRMSFWVRGLYGILLFIGPSFHSRQASPCHLSGWLPSPLLGCA